ncbi:putative S-adenosyl methyltransferase [Nocardia nova SH22a]|uniref:Putative S-adenosyl methyltransferase n=1 Tax=Nocardia nova SH22a TaxID=1415166 RepID=W5T9B6_9NOCA|nr:SAM-dependent methyltransferase [Nocardia nova]AHH15588.1 putative S-adenosyl methyltransferase [Nocardia nova SH22a]
MAENDSQDWLPDTIDPMVPSAARVYDYQLGGVHNFAVDRALGDQARIVWPDIAAVAQANRAFLQRAVRYLSAAGIDQFLDIGSGVPTVGNVHEIALAADPTAHVVYVDIDPVAVECSRALLIDEPNVTVVQADFNRIDALLAHPELTRLIDFTRPVAVLLVALLHVVADDDHPERSLARLRDALPWGSYLALSHLSDEGPAERVRGIEELSQAMPTPIRMRSRERITAYLDGFDLIDPGLVQAPAWRPDHPDDLDDDPDRFYEFAAVARVR